MDRQYPPSAYVHLPFCAHRCGYCDFATVAGQDDLMASYLAALDREMQSVLREPIEVATIFVGGGTPTYLPPNLLEQFTSRLNYWFKSAPNLANQTDPLARFGNSRSQFEFTFESNPNTLTAEKAAILKSAAVNRISFGAQSFSKPVLKVLERDHDPDNVARAITLIGPEIVNYSLDLIFAVPGQTLEVLEHDLDSALALAPNHLSTYGLTFEKGTPLYRQMDRGEIVPVDPDWQRAMFELVLAKLEGAGFVQYEISNFARPEADGFLNLCRHNLVYWANLDCYGFGLGAAGYVAGERTLNTRHLETYVKQCHAQESPVIQRERLSPIERARETVFTQLRTMAGIDRADFAAQTGIDLDQVTAHREHLMSIGLIDDSAQRLRLTREGLFVADSVLAKLLDTD